MAIGSDALQLVLKIKADSSQAEKELKKFKDELRGIEKAAKDQLSPLQTLAASTGMSAEKFTQLKAGALAAVAGIAAITGVAVATGAALFKLAKDAAEFGSAIFDASEKTGLSAETLSSLKFAADQSGSSLEAITAATARFAKVVGEAAEGSEEASAKLKKFGVDPQEAINDLDGALAKVFQTIVNAKPGIEQLTLAQNAFGRSGADIIPTIKSFDGDMGKLIKTAKDLGLTLSNEDARAADQFGDQLDTLNKQLSGVARTIGQELIPIFNELARDVSSWLSANKGEVKSWGEEFAKWIKFAAAEVRLFKLDIDSLKSSLAFAGAGFSSSPEQDAKDRQRDIERKRLTNQSMGTDIGSGSWQVDDEYANRNKLPYAKKSTFGDADTKAAEDAAKAREDARKRDLAAQKDHIKQLLQIKRDEFEQDQKGFEEAFRNRDITEDQFRETSENNYKIYTAKVKKLLVDAFKIDAKDKTAAEIANLRLAKESANQAIDNEVQREREDRDKLFLAAAQRTAEVEIQIAEDTADRKFEIEQSLTQSQIELIERRKEAEAEIGRFDAAIADARLAHEGRIKLLRDEIAELKRLVAVKKAEAEAEQDPVKKKELLNEAEQTAHVLRLKTIQLQTQEAEGAKNLKKEILELNEAREDQLELLRQTNEELRKRREIDYSMPDPVKPKDRTPGDDDPFGKWKESWREWLEQFAEGVGIMETQAGTIQATLGGMAEVLQRAFEGLANAIAQTVFQYVMYGKTAPAVLRTILAATLAQIAAEATYQAIKAAAIGFMMLATGQYDKAANAFISAAMWGTLAVGAALVGRAIAPKQAASGATARQTSGAGGTGQRDRQGNSDRGGAYSDKEEITIDANRNTPFTQRAQRIDINLGLNSNGVLEVLKTSASNNGTFRNLVLNVTGEL